MFGKTTVATIPETLTTCHMTWERYIADIWFDLLIKQGLNEDGVLVEVAPGSSLKIGLALGRANFKGTIYLVDPLHTVVAATAARYRDLMPAATVIPIAQTLEGAMKQLPSQPQFILAHHPLDDMLMGAAAAHFDEELFDCSCQRHRDHCLLIEDRPEHFISEVTAMWEKAIAELQPLNTIICQYPSLVQRENNLFSLNAFAAATLAEIKKTGRLHGVSQDHLQGQLNQYENYNNAHIGMALLDAKNWMVAYCHV